MLIGTRQKTARTSGSGGFLLSFFSAIQLQPLTEIRDKPFDLSLIGE